MPENWVRTYESGLDYIESVNGVSWGDGKVPPVTIGRTVEAKASSDDGKMTLGDVKTFIAEMDSAGAADSTTIEARITWGSALKSLKATAVRFGDLT